MGVKGGYDFKTTRHHFVFNLIYFLTSDPRRETFIFFKPGAG